MLSVHRADELLHRGVTDIIRVRSATAADAATIARFQQDIQPDPGRHPGRPHPSTLSGTHAANNVTAPHRHHAGQAASATARTRGGPHTDADCMPDTDRSVGIDLGLTHFAVLADGTKIDSPRFLRRAEKRNASAVARCGSD